MPELIGKIIKLLYRNILTEYIGNSILKNQWIYIMNTMKKGLIYMDNDKSYYVYQLIDPQSEHKIQKTDINSERSQILK